MKRDNSLSKLLRRKNVSWYDVESVEDVLADILSRLPAKCLLCLKAVSKRWHRLICSQSLTKLHLSRSGEKAVYILYPYMHVKRSMYLIDADGETIETITIPGFENLSSVSMICSYNGLIFFTNYPWVPISYKALVEETDLEIRICNPATCEVRLLPKCSPLKQELGIGVSFGPGISEYRVFRFFHSKSESLVVRPECEIFSSSTGTWRGIGCVHHCPMDARHVFVNGQVYWFISSEEDRHIPESILSVDMEDNFKVISLPDEVTLHSFLIDLEGFLSLVAVYDDDEIVEIWILKDENESEWEMKCSDHIPWDTIECLDSVTARNNDIFFVTSDHYFIFNTDQRTWKQLYYEYPNQQNVHVVLKYRESLLPCS